MERAQVVSHLIDRLYEAALDSSLWPQFLEPFAHFLDSSGVAMFVQDFDEGRGKTSSLGFAATALIAPDYLQSFDGHYGAVNVWSEKMKSMVPGSPVTDPMLYPRNRLTRTEWYDGWLRPQDYLASMGVILAKQDSLSVNLTLLRSERKGDYSEDDVRSFRVLVPHVQRAIALHAKFGALENWKANACEVFERLKVGVVLVDAGGKAIFVNAAARQTIAASRCLRIEANREVSVTGSKEARAFRSAIAGALGDPFAANHAPVHIQIGSSGAAPLTLTIAPLARKSVTSDFFPVQCPAAVVFIADPERQLDVPASLLIEQYGFTGAEALLACALLRGETLNDFAKSRGITRNTAMTQLKGVMAKTGQTRQVDVVRSILAGPIDFLFG